MVYRKKGPWSTYGATSRREHDVDRHWWTKTKESLAQSVSGNLHILKEQDKSKQSRHLALLSLYKNKHLGKGKAYGSAHNGFGTGSLIGNAKNNVIRVRTDAVINRISKHRPMPNLSPTRANYSIRRRCKLVGQYVQSKMDTLGMPRLGPKAALDGCVVGMGVLRPYRIHSDIKIRRVSAGDIFVDEIEAAHDNITQLFERAVIARSVALYNFVDKPAERGELKGRELKDRREAIMDANPIEDTERLGEHMISDPIEMAEAWHLPSARGAGDGIHAVVCGGALLGSEEYTYDDFPHTFFNWSHDPTGFWPTSLAEELIDCHIVANHLEDRIEELVDHNPGVIVFADRRSNVSESDMTNLPFRMMEYDKAPPNFHVMNSIPREFLELRQQNEFKADRIARLHNGGMMPASLQTGAAVTEWNDADAESFSIVLQEYEHMFMDVAKKIIRLSREAYDEDKSFSVVARKDRYSVSRINWSEVDMDEDEFVISVQPTSSLPRTVSKRIDKAIELHNAGAFDQITFLQSLDIPDVEGRLAELTAEKDAVERMCEIVLDEGIPQFIDPVIEPKLAHAVIKRQYLMACNDGVPEDRIVMLQNLLNTASERIQQQRIMVAASQMGIVDPTQPPAIDEQGQNPLAATGQGALQ